MLLSDILKEIGDVGEIRIRNEAEFDTLALLGADTVKKTCTFLDDGRYIHGITKLVSMVLTTDGLAGQLEAAYGGSVGYCAAEDPRLLFFKIHNHLSENPRYIRQRRRTEIGAGCQISPLAVVAPENVVIGSHAVIEEFAVIRENTVIGDHSIIRSGAKIGGQGFEFKRTGDGVMEVAHLGGVVIGNHVEIQYNTCVDRAVYPWDDTVIGDFSKVDDLVYLAHGCKVGSRVLIAAQSVVGGRVEIGDGTWLGLNAAVRNGAKIGRSARANMGAVVTQDVPDGGSVTGNFAVPHQEFIRALKARDGGALYRGGGKFSD